MFLKNVVNIQGDATTRTLWQGGPVVTSGLSRTLNFKSKSITGMIFQQGKPVLDSELNALSEINRRLQNDVLSAIFTAGFRAKGAVTSGIGTVLEFSQSSYFLNGLALVNLINANNSGNANLRNKITLAAAPGAGTRNDLVYVEFWFEELEPNVSAQSQNKVVYVEGGSDSGVLTNDLYDATANQETARAIQLRWKLRYASPDFNTYPNGIDDPAIKAFGGSGVASARVFTAYGNGLYTAGNDDLTDATTFKSIEGVVYATPLFKVVRTAGEANINTGTVVDLRSTLTVQGLDIPANLGYTPVNKAGDTMTGKFNTVASATGGAGFSMGIGVDPTSPVNGDMWFNASNFSFRFGGVTYNVATKAGNTFTDTQILLASTTTKPPLRFPAGVDVTSLTTGDFWFNGTNLKIKTASATLTIPFKESGNSWTVKQVFAASTTGGASVNMPHGTAPTSPVNGDMWTDTAGLKVYINSLTQDVAFKGPNIFTGRQTFMASTTSNSSMNVAPGAAVTSPVDGDVWYDGTDFWFRNGTKTRKLTTDGFRGVMTNIAARDALTGNVSGDWVVVISNASSKPQIDVYTGSAWTSISGGGGAMLPPSIVAVSDGVTTTYAAPGTASNVWVIVGNGEVKYSGVDYDMSGNNVVFRAGKIPAKGLNIAMSAATDALVGTDAATLGGASASVTAGSTNTLVKRTAGGATNLLMTDIEAAAGVTVAALKTMPIVVGHNGKPAASQEIFIMNVVAPFNVPINATGSIGLVRTNPTGAATYTMKKNGTSFGTINVSTSGVVTFTVALQTSFIVGDIFTVEAPSVADATLSTMSATIKASIV